MTFNRRNIVMLGAVVLIAGCKVIPKGTPTPAPLPDDRPTDALPADQQRHRIALLVPLSGPNAAVGESFANATTMALLDTNAQSIRITTYDTAGGAAAAATRAVRDGNKLILGPLQGEEVAPVATVARSARVPLISYASDSTVAARDVFVMGTVPASSLGRTVGYARGRGITRFAILTPNGDYGARARVAFDQAVVAAGGTVVASEGYDRANPSVISAARRLKTKGGFEAVLIADGARFAVLAAPQLKAAGTAGPRILGTELWSGEAAIGSTPALRGSWFAAISDSRFKAFADSYQSRFGSLPHRVATQGYDSVLLTIRIARDWRPGTPFPTARLVDSGGFLGLDGPFRFTSNGLIERALEVREARAGGVAVVSPAPDKFGD
ncbi:MAG: penicillin-binding protein activator [Novosphingobium sp.]|jgi:ABC-type branched-subunit amino acid transport system substrate-binding protein|nr:penicillin-binding protein activator [Novosphingobium sp.]